MLQSVFDQSFQSKVIQWLHESRELLVMLRYPNAGGTRDYELHTGHESIARRLSEVPAQTSVIIFRDPQLQLRGIVTGNFIEAAVAHIPDGVEFLIVESALTTYGKHSWYRNASGTTHSELREELESCFDRPVIFGPYPPWLEDGPGVISGYVPDATGVIKPGAY